MPVFVGPVNLVRMGSGNSSGYRCTLVVPTYNAAAFIDRTVTRLRRFVAEHPDWLVLFVCDGCRDNTVEVLRKLIRDDEPGLRVHAYDKNRGKGFALRRGLDLANTPYLLYTDVDLAYDPDESIRLLSLLENGADVVAVNRANPDSRFIMSPQFFPTIYRRHIMSRIFNWWLRQVLPIAVLDTQAGLKGMTLQAWKQLSPWMETDGFFFDVELLARAGRIGMKFAESPVVFTYHDPTTVKMVSHGASMFVDTMKLRRKLKRMDQGMPPDSSVAAATPKSE